MNKTFTALNVQFDGASGEQTLISFANPRDEFFCLQTALRTIFESMGFPVRLIKNPPEHGAFLWTAYYGRTLIAWVTLTPTENIFKGENAVALAS